MITPEHIDAVRRMIAFLREWDSEANNEDADLLEELVDELAASRPVRHTTGVTTNSDTKETTMQFGNQAIIEAGIDELDAAARLTLAAQLVASVVHNEGVGGIVHSYQASASRGEIMDDFNDQVDELIAREGSVFSALI